MERDLTETSPPQGTTVIEAGEAIDHVYFPQSGMISLLVVTSDGDMIEATMVGREGGVGLHRGLGDRRSFTRATVQIPGRFSSIGAHAFQAVSEGSAPVRRIIARYTEVLWAEAQQITACNAIHHASSRLCRWLLQSSDRANSERLPLTQELLSQMLGIRRTTVTLLAQELQKKGAIKYSRGTLTIIDRTALENSACECYRVIQHINLPLRLGVTL